MLPSHIPWHIKQQLAGIQLRLFYMWPYFKDTKKILALDVPKIVGFNPDDYPIKNAPNS